jgi:hypothetical protein
MNEVLAVLGLAGPLSLITSLLVIALLSQRLGTITKQGHTYRWLFAAIGLVAVAVVIRLWTLNSAEDPPYPLLMAVALTIGLVTAWYYWGWLLSEREYHALSATSGHTTERKPR